MRDVGLPALNTESDRFMICGSPSMLKDTCRLLKAAGFEETRSGKYGHFVIERAFVEH
jgi:ferredoxin--NADP+ reductase